MLETQNVTHTGSEMICSHWSRRRNAQAERAGGEERSQKAVRMAQQRWSEGLNQPRCHLMTRASEVAALGQPGSSFEFQMQTAGPPAVQTWLATHAGACSNSPPAVVVSPPGTEAGD